MLIKLTGIIGEQNKDFYIEHESIILMFQIKETKGKEKDRLFTNMFFSSGDSLTVNETPEQILELIKGVK